MNLNENIFSKSVDWKEFVPYKHNEDFLNDYASKINWILYFNKYKSIFNSDFIIKYIRFFKRSEVIYISKKIEINEDTLKIVKILDQKTIFSRKDIDFSKIKSTEIDDWDTVSNNYCLTEDFIVENLDKLNLTSVASNGLLPLNIFEKNLGLFLDKRNKIANKYLIRNKFSLDFIIKNLELFYVDSLVSYQKLTPELLEDLIDNNNRLFKNVNLARIPTKLNPSFIRKYLKDYNPYEFSRYQPLSEDEIDELSDIVSWKTISVFKILSDDFLIRNKELIDWIALFDEGYNRHYHYNDSNFEKYVAHCTVTFPDEYKKYLDYREINRNNDSDYYDDFYDD